MHLSGPEATPARPAERGGVMGHDIPYWLCCGSLAPAHDDERGKRCRLYHLSTLRTPEQLAEQRKWGAHMSERRAIATPSEGEAKP